MTESSSFLEFTPDFLNTPQGVAELNRILDVLNISIVGDTDAVRVFKGFGSPEGVVGASVGALYMRLDGGTDTTLYTKESGVNANGWVARSNVTLPLSTTNGGTGGDFSGTAQGNIWYFSNTGVLSALAPGTDGQYLETNGAGANPSWSTVNTTSDIELISTTTMDGSSGNSGNITIVQGIDYYVVVNLKPSSAASIALRFNSSSGAEYANNGETKGNANEAYLSNDNSVSAAEGLHANFTMSTTATDMMMISGTGFFNNGGTFERALIGCMWDKSTTVTDFEMFSAQNLTGEIILYKLNTA